MRSHLSILLSKISSGLDWQEVPRIKVKPIRKILLSFLEVFLSFSSPLYLS